MRALGRDHSQRGDKLRLSRLQGPRRTRLRDQRAEVAPGLVRARRSARRWLWVEAALLCRLSWAMLNFALTEFSEVRGARDLSHKPAALRLLDVPRRLYPRPHDLAVLRCPSPCARWRVVLIVDHGLQAVDLLLG